MGNGSYALSQFLTIIIIGRFLGAESVGIYSLALAIVTPLLIFLNLGLRMQLMTDVKKEIPIAVYKKTQILSSIIGVFLIVILCLIFDLDNEIGVIIALIGIMKSIEYQSELYYGYLQRKKLNKVVSLSLFVKSLVFVSFIFLGVYLKYSLINTVCIATLFYCVVGIIFDNVNIKKRIEIGREKIKKEYLIKILKIGLPLSLSTLLISMNVNLPRIILGKYDLEQLGYFASIVAFMQIGTLLVVSVGQVFAGKMANYYQDGDFKKYYYIAIIGVVLAFIIGLTSILIAYFFGNYILNLLLGYEYSSSLIFYVFLIAPFQYMMTMFGYIQGATRKSRNLLFVNILVFTVISVLSILLIPLYKIYGLILAMLIAFVLGCISYGFIMVKGYRKLVES